MPETSRDTLPTPADASREVDLLLADLDLVLRCRCCEPRDGFFADEGWSVAETRTIDPFQGKFLQTSLIEGESR